MSLSCTKHSYLVTDIDELAPTLAEAFEVAKAGRPGPVIVDIAKDVQLAQAPVDSLPSFTPPLSPHPGEQALVAAQNLLSQCTRLFLCRWRRATWTSNRDGTRILTFKSYAFGKHLKRPRYHRAP